MSLEMKPRSGQSLVVNEDALKTNPTSNTQKL